MFSKDTERGTTAKPSPAISGLTARWSCESEGVREPEEKDVVVREDAGTWGFQGGILTGDVQAWNTAMERSGWIEDKARSSVKMP